MKRFLLSLLPGLLLAVPTLIAFPEIAPDSGIRIKVDQVFPDTVTDLLPCRVTIWNNSGRDGDWTLVRHTSVYGKNSGTSTDRARFHVNAGETRTFDVLLQGVSESASTRLVLTGTDIIAGPGSVMNLGSRNALFAASNSLELPLLAPYRDHISKAKGGYIEHPSVFNPAKLMADWRSFVGHSRIILSSDDWNRVLSPDVRNALRQWVAAGGELYIHSEGGEIPLWEKLHLSGNSGPVPYGGGYVKHLSPDQIVRTIAMLKSKRATASNAVFADSPNLRDATIFIFIFAFAFASIIGPVNLLFFAPSACRQRLFWTTPAISLASTAVLLLAILLKDGVGGTGKRYLVIRLLPDSHEAIVSQTQAATTGALLSRNFEISEPSALLENPKDDRGGGSNKAGQHYSGDWFRVRAKDAHRIHALRSSRMGVTFLPSAGAPEIISSIEAPLSTVILCDAQRQYWKATNVRAGEKTRLERMDAPQRSEWMEIAVRTPNASNELTLTGLADASKKPDRQYELAPGSFVALLDDTSPFVIDTLRSISWQDTGIVAGPLLSSVSPAPAQ